MGQHSDEQASCPWASNGIRILHVCRGRCRPHEYCVRRRLRGHRDVGAFVAAEWRGPILELR